jgi:hypothetical protein
MTWLPRVMMPAAVTSRCTSTQLVAASAPGAFPGRGRSCGAGAVVAEPGQVNGGKPGGDGLDPPPSDAEVHGGGVDPEPDLLADPACAEPELLRADGHVPRRRDHPVHLDGIGPARRFSSGRDSVGCRACSADGFQVGRCPQLQTVAGLRSRLKLAGGGGHVQGLVRAAVVVFLPPRVDCGLSFLNRGERPGVVEELVLEGLVRAFYLPRRGRRVRLGEQLPDAVAAADPLEQHLGRAGLAESAGELLAVIRQDFVGCPVGPHRCDERPAHRPPSCASDDGGDHAEPGVIVDPGDQLQLEPRRIAGQLVFRIRSSTGPCRSSSP